MVSDPLLNHPAIIQVLEHVRQKQTISGEEFDELFGSWVAAADRDSIVALLEQHGVTLVAEEAADDDLIRLYLREIGKEKLLNAEQVVSLYKRMEMGKNVVNEVIESCGATLRAFYIAERARSTQHPRELSQTKKETSENTFARDGLVDLSGPVISLSNLTPEELFVLLANIRRVFHSGDQPGERTDPLPDEALHAFMQHCSDRVGDSYFRTPRNTVTAFVDLLAVIEQNPGGPGGWRPKLPSC